MSTTLVLAGQVMDRAANLLNDPNKTDYTYKVMLPYLNLAIEEYSDLLVESNHTFANITSSDWPAVPIIVTAGSNTLTPPEYIPPSGTPPYANYPLDLIEIQEIGERVSGDLGAFRRLPRREFGERYPPTNSLIYWIFERGFIRFNLNGANVDIEVEIKFMYQGVTYAADENTQINVIGARTYLAYQTAALCARFIGENETRAQILELKASESADRSLNISNKGRQEIMTRHRPFRAAFKSRGRM